MKLKPKAPAACAPLKPTCITVIPENWSVSRGDLELVDPRAWLDTVVADMYRVGAAKADGFCFLSLHGAYDATTDTYPLHVHVIASGGMIDVFDRMRELRRYQPAVPGDGSDRANQPIMITRKPLRNVPGALSYVMRGWWPLRETYLDNRGVRCVRRMKQQQISEPAHSEYLAWLDRWGIDDLTRKVRLRVIDGKLTVR